MENKPAVDIGAVRRFMEFKDTDITKSIIIEYFSQRPKMKDGKFIGVSPPTLYVDDPITLEAGSLPNIKERVATTIGRYFFNMYCVASIFGDYIPYINKSMSNKDITDLQQAVVDLILENKVSPDQFGAFQTRIIWLNNFTEIFIPGMTIRLLTPLPEVEARKAELIKQYAKEIEAGDYVKVAALIEKELLKMAEERLKDDPGWPLYAAGVAPSFGNNYKNTQVMLGPIKDPITGKYQISTRSFANGLPKRQFSLYANTLVSGSYARGVATQDGGAKTKYLFAALQSEILDERGTDCGTETYEEFTIDKDNYKTFLYRWIKTKNGEILLTRDNIKQVIDKKVEMRSPLFCTGQKFCSKCVGDLYYRIGISNIGLTVTKITSTLLNLSLKNMHDTSVKTIEFDPFEYMKIIA